MDICSPSPASPSLPPQTNNDHPGATATDTTATVMEPKRASRAKKTKESPPVIAEMKKKRGNAAIKQQEHIPKVHKKEKQRKRETDNVAVVDVVKKSARIRERLQREEEEMAVAVKKTKSFRKTREDTCMPPPPRDSVSRKRSKRVDDVGQVPLPPPLPPSRQSKRRRLNSYAVVTPAVVDVAMRVTTTTTATISAPVDDDGNEDAPPSTQDLILTPHEEESDLPTPPPPQEEEEQEREQFDDAIPTSTSTIDASCPKAIARDWIQSALRCPRSEAAAATALRPSLQSAVDIITNNIESTIKDGENNSLLIMGGHGAGKTLAVERALRRIDQRWNAQRESTDPLVGIVRLVGSAHAEERTAFKEIARQLCTTFGLDFSKGASVHENIGFLRQVLEGLARAHKVAVFFLEDFDLFAHKNKQTLLYCLLDALQTTGVQAVVVGTTVQYNCLDLLEKRVKSRFSHRHVMVHPPRSATTVVNSFGGNGKALEEEAQEEEEGARRTKVTRNKNNKKKSTSPSKAPLSPSSTSQGRNVPSTRKREGEASMDVLRMMLALPSISANSITAAEATSLAWIEAHNARVDTICTHPEVIKAVSEFVSSRNDLHHLHVIVRNALCIASVENDKAKDDGIVTVSSVIASCRQLKDSYNYNIESCISGLSVLELVVLVSAHRAARRAANGAVFNFEMTAKEFMLFANSGDHVDNYTKSAASKAYHKLKDMGLLRPVRGKRGDTHVSAANINFTPMQVNFTMDELRAGISKHSTCPFRLRDWAVREGGPMTTAAAMLG